jgi:hypothetical protein
MLALTYDSMVTVYRMDVCDDFRIRSNCGWWLTWEVRPWILSN